MKALMLEGTDGLQSAAVRAIEEPVPRAGEVLVDIKAAALNHRELWIARGQYPGMVPTPFALGCDGAGIIEAVGDGVDRGRVGEAVVLYPGLNWGADKRFPAPDFGLLGMPGPGTIAEKICVPAASAVPKPEHLDFEQAAAIGLAGLTAWRGLNTKGGLKAGERLLLTGVGGGVALFALQLAVKLGALVYVTSGSDQTVARAIELGAKAGFNYHEEGWRKALPKAAGGIDLVFDGAPASSYANYGRALAMGARVVVYGSTGGMQFSVNAPELFLKNVNVIGTNVGNPEEFAAMVAFVAKERIEPVIERRFTLDDAAAALGFLHDGHKLGKIVIAT
ncbi:MAG TPA: zinc-binding dehydrogenase [Steroidobacteraceae bacterium]|jgi:NADPH:quinone reductase-like Zn-dependent oxidoreductase